MNDDLSTLSIAEKRARLSQLLGAPRDALLHAPLSAGQMRLWQAEQLSPGLCVYNLSIVHFLSGPLNTRALQQAISHVVGRHESLRTTFAVLEGRPTQVIAPTVVMDLPIIDVACANDSDWTATARRLAVEEAAQPFDLQRGPLCRFKLWRRSVDEFALSIVVHHIIADRWSVGILAQELSASYAALTESHDDPQSSRPLQYVEFVKWQSEWLASDAVVSQLAFWRARFANELQNLRLPWDHRNASMLSKRSQRLVFHLNGNLLERVPEFCERMDVTPFAALLSAFAALLFRHTSQPDLILCTPVAGRHHPETKGVIGYFNNVLPLRLEVTSELTLSALVRRADRTIKETINNQEPAFQQIAGLSSLGRLQLSRCLFSLQSTPSPRLRLSGVVSRYEDVPTNAADFDLALFIESQDGKYIGILDYKSELCLPADAERFAEDYLALLARLLDHADETLGDAKRDLDAVCSAPSKQNDKCLEAENKNECRQRQSDPAAELVRSEVERRLVELWEEAFNTHPISRRANFFDLGGRSLLAARLFQRIEETFGQQLPLSMLLEAPTIEQMAQRMSQQGYAPSWSCLVPLQPQGILPALFLVHAGGGNVLSYHRLSKYLGANQALWGLQAQGLNHSQAALSSIEEIASHYINAIESIQPHGPYFLGGHSMGGLIAYEMAQQFLSRGETVACLMVFDHPGPAATRRWGDHLRWHLTCLAQLETRDRIKYIQDRLAWKFRSNRLLPMFLRRVGAGLLTHGGVAKSSWRLKTLESSLDAIDRYLVRPYRGRLTLVRAQRASPAIHSDPTGGWGQVAVQGVDVREVPGDHMSMFEEPQLPVVAAIVRSCMAESQTSPNCEDHNALATRLRTS